MKAGSPDVADHPLRVAVVGYGRWGRNHARVASTTPGVRLVGVVEPDSSARTTAHERYGQRAWPDLAQALTDNSVEAVVIATPAASHASLALESLEAGRHVLIEKPAAMTVSEAVTIAKCADRAGVQVSAGHTFLYAQPIRNLATYLRQANAEPWLVRSERLGGRRRHDCDVLWNLAPHDVSIMLYLANEPVVSVAARAHVFPGGHRWDLATVELDFASGLRGEVYVGWRHAGAKRSLRVIGDDWAIRYRHGLPGGDVLRAEGSADTQGAREMLADRCERAGDDMLHGYREPLSVQFEEFAQACRRSRPSLTGPAHFLAVTRVLEAAALSAADGGSPIDIRQGEVGSEPGSAQPPNQSFRVAHRGETSTRGGLA